jgi:hypothetical protein
LVQRARPLPSGLHSSVAPFLSVDVVPTALFEQ